MKPIYQITVYEDGGSYISVAGKPGQTYEEAWNDETTVVINTANNQLIYALKQIEEYLIGMDQFADRLQYTKFKKKPELTKAQINIFRLLGHPSGHGISREHGVPSEMDALRN